MTKTKEASDREIFISRVVNATQERVWKALSDPKQLDAWWGPEGFRNKTSEFSFKPGGLWKHVMIGPDGAEYPNTTQFLDIAPPDYIVYAVAGGKKGERGISFQMTWTLKNLGGKTEVTIHHVFEKPEDRDFVVKVHGAIKGGEQTLARLDAHVAEPGITGEKPGKPGFELRLERVVDAPLKRVWRAWSDPEQLKKWFAPRPLTLRVDKMDFRSGGGFAMAMVFPDGKRHDFSGIYREVAPQSRIVWTGEFPGDPKDNIRTEISFEDLGGRTKINVLQTFAVLTPVNEQATQGARQGWTMTLDQLTEVCLA